MNKITLTLPALSLSALLLTACTSTQVGTVGGAAAGAGLGYVATGGDPLGTLFGAGLGGFIGNQIGQAQEPRYYYPRRYVNVYQPVIY